MTTIEKLHFIKAESDRHHYEVKARELRTMIEAAPQDWTIDSEADGLTGVTHKSGYRFHMPHTAVPEILRVNSLATPAVIMEFVRVPWTPSVGQDVVLAPRALSTG